jgi:hypothetical protein
MQVGYKDRVRTRKADFSFINTTTDPLRGGPSDATEFKALFRGTIHVSPQLRSIPGRGSGLNAEIRRVSLAVEVWYVAANAWCILFIFNSLM